MTSWIGIPYWIIKGIRIPIPRHRIPRAGHDGIGLRESAQSGVIPASHVKHEAEVIGVGVGVRRAGVGVVGGEGAGLVANFTPGFVEGGGVGVGFDGGIHSRHSSRITCVGEALGNILPAFLRNMHGFLARSESV